MERIDPAAEFEGGNSALAEGRAGDAVRHYRRALRVAPDVVEVHHNLAAALARLFRREEAVEAARRGLASRPDFAPLQVALANLLSEAGQYDAARTHYQAALRQDDKLAAAWSGLAGVAMAQGAFEEASGNYQTSLRLSPKNPVAMNNLAICEQRLGHAHDALSLYRDLAVLNLELGQVQNNLGQVLQGLGRHDEAVAAFRRALELEQQSDERIDNVAPFLMQSLMYQCAWEDLGAVRQQVLEETRRRLDDSLPITVQPFSLAGTDADGALRLAAARSYSAHCARKVASCGTGCRFAMARRKIRPCASAIFHRISASIVSPKPSRT
ncbi:MAG: tetratricopeptide repeat protein [Alphaproteobacteria bacterium]